jgi:hypothetical protein
MPVGKGIFPPCEIGCVTRLHIRSPWMDRGRLYPDHTKPYSLWAGYLLINSYRIDYFTHLYDIQGV